MKLQYKSTVCVRGLFFSTNIITLRIVCREFNLKKLFFCLLGFSIFSTNCIFNQTNASNVQNFELMWWMIFQEQLYVSKNVFREQYKLTVQSKWTRNNYVNYKYVIKWFNTLLLFVWNVITTMFVLKYKTFLIYYERIKVLWNLVVVFGTSEISNVLHV